MATSMKNEYEILAPHLSKNTWMGVNQLVGRGAKVGGGLGKNLQGIPMVVSPTFKRNRYGIGYQSGEQRRSGRSGSQKENKMVRFNLVFPPLSWTFRSRRYINSDLPLKDENIVTPLLALTINAIIEEEETIENARPTVHPYTPDCKLNNWSIVEIPITYKLSE